VSSPWLQTQSGAHVDIDKSNDGTSEPRKITVSGPKGCVEVAMKMIADLLQGGRSGGPGGKASLFAHTLGFRI
jgi:far upstream element-binding protein